MASESERVTAELEEFVEAVITKITLDVTANLIETTPVDTGWARANWIPNLSGPLPDDVSGVEPTRQAAQSRGGVQQEAVGRLATGGYRIEAGAIYVSNNVPYILALNDGHSKQRPAGFVQRAIVKAVTTDIQSLRA